MVEVKSRDDRGADDRAGPLPMSMPAELPLEEALRRADVKEPWITAWTDPAIVKGYWEALSGEDRGAWKRAALEIISVWPSQWRPGVLLDESKTSVDIVLEQALAADYKTQLDKLLDEILEDACLFRVRWLALIPQDTFNLADSTVFNKGRGIGEYAHPAQVQYRFIPWQWWRPFLSRLEERLGLEPSAGQKKQEGDYVFRRDLPQLSGGIVNQERIALVFSARVQIDKMPASAEGHCVITMSPGASEDSPEGRKLLERLS